MARRTFAGSSGVPAFVTKSQGGSSVHPDFLLGIAQSVEVEPVRLTDLVPELEFVSWDPRVGFIYLPPVAERMIRLHVCSLSQRTRASLAMPAVGWRG